jgi:hypothetical protein
MDYRTKSEGSMTYFALNKSKKTVAVIEGATWDEIRLRCMFGLAMPDGTVASGIGRFPGTVDGVKSSADRQGMTFLGVIQCA